MEGKKTMHDVGNKISDFCAFQEGKKLRRSAEGSQSADEKVRLVSFREWLGVYRE